MSQGNPAATPTIPDDLYGDGRWMSLHKRLCTDAQEKEPEVVFIGDSIIAYLGYTELWDKLFAPMHALNFGVGGERVENVLWRVLNGEMEQMSPKAVVVLVGTNNNGHTPDQISEGLVAIADAIHEKQPQAHALILSLLPRGEKPNSIRDRNAAVNELLKKALQSKTKTQLVNIDPGFVHHDGSISHHDMWDYLHLTKSGYSKAFEPVHELLQQLLGENDVDAEVISKVLDAEGDREVE